MRPVAQIAQSVEQGIENPRVGGSIPSLGTTFRFQVMPSTPESTQEARLVRAFCCLGFSRRYVSRFVRPSPSETSQREIARQAHSGRADQYQSSRLIIEPEIDVSTSAHIWMQVLAPDGGWNRSGRTNLSPQRGISAIPKREARCWGVPEMCSKLSILLASRIAYFASLSDYSLRKFSPPRKGIRNDETVRTTLCRA